MIRNDKWNTGQNKPITGRWMAKIHDIGFLSDHIANGFPILMPGVANHNGAPSPQPNKLTA